MLNAAATGRISGTTTKIAEKMSIRQPTTSRNPFRMSRNTHRDSMPAVTQAAPFAGTCASIR